MCGFAGFCGSRTDRIAEIVEKMGELIAHRGPDSKGVFCEDGVALGFRRLSIIDLAGGSQPIYSPDKRYVIVFNGEIYNYRELRASFEKEGRTFATDSDTETILAAYERYGEDAASHLRGMFAFVIYDREKKTLYGARDYFGIKPFYYTLCGEKGEDFLFASEIKAFLAHPSFHKELNRDALKLYLEFQYSPMEETIFKGVYKLSPGTSFTYSRENGLQTKRYFEPCFDPKNRSFEETVKLIDESVASSVKYHQIADVEVGSFLSGGVDSSYVVSLVRPDKTYSVGFEVKGFDETDLASELCKRLGIKNARKEISPDEFFDALPMVQYHSDEPHANLSAVPLYFLSELAARDVKVVLSGEGADEFFGGYDWYLESKPEHFVRSLPMGIRKGLASTLGKLPNAHLKRFFKSCAERVEDTYIGQAFIMKDDEADALLKKDYRSPLGYHDVTRPYYEKVKDCDDLTKKLYLDMNLWLPNDILLKADKMTMAHSLELRVPYLDKEVFALARTLTNDQKTKGREAKRAFRTAALSHIPTDWANRKKAGFLVPFREWIKEEKYGDRLRKAFSTDYAKEIFDTDRLIAMLDEHCAGKANHARKLYTVYSFLLWYEQYFILR